MKVEHGDAPQAIAPTDKERSAGVYTPRNLQRVLSGLHQDGLVVLRGVIDLDHVDAINKAMCEDAEKRIADPTQVFNHDIKCEALSHPTNSMATIDYTGLELTGYTVQPTSYKDRR